MVLYICRDLPGASWITEVDLSRTELRDVNFYVATVTKSQQATERAERKWTELTAKSPGLYDGELMSLREVKVTREGRIKAGIAKSQTNLFPTLNCFIKCIFLFNNSLATIFSIFVSKKGNSLFSNLLIVKLRKRNE